MQACGSSCPARDLHRYVDLVKIGTYGTYIWENTMTQLHFYVPDALAEQIKARAAQAKMPVSRYVAELVKRDVGPGWPKDYFKRISGRTSAAAIVHEPSGLPEERQPLE